MTYIELLLCFCYNHFGENNEKDIIKNRGDDM